MADKSKAGEYAKKAGLPLLPQMNLEYADWLDKKKPLWKTELPTTVYFFKESIKK